MNNRSNLFAEFQISILTSRASKLRLIKIQPKINLSLLYL